MKGITIPSYYVFPKELFQRQEAINVAEAEFPAYFNFFIQKKVLSISYFFLTFLQDCLFYMYSTARSFNSASFSRDFVRTKGNWPQTRIHRDISGKYNPWYEERVFLHKNLQLHRWALHFQAFWWQRYSHTPARSIINYFLLFFLYLPRFRNRIHWIRSGNSRSWRWVRYHRRWSRTWESSCESAITQERLAKELSK